jgi:hypothetical protein
MYYPDDSYLIRDTKFVYTEYKINKYKDVKLSLWSMSIDGWESSVTDTTTFTHAKSHKGHSNKSILDM